MKDKEIKKQVKWQRKKIREGNCMICGKKRGRFAFYCDEHRKRHNKYKQMKYKSTKKKRLRSKCDKLWFDIIMKSATFPYPLCWVCDKSATQAHHFYPKGSFGHIRYLLDNGIPTCQGCHFEHHHKGNPNIHQTIISKRGKRWHNRLIKKANNRPNGSYITVKWYEQHIKSLTKATNN